MYCEGIVTQKNLEQAYVYMLLSAANGNLTAKGKQKAIVKEMTPEQIEAAKELTSELINKIAE